MNATALIMLAVMNTVRGDYPLELASDLSAKAEIRAKQLCGKPLSHDGWQTVFKGLPYRVMGENLAKGFKTPQSAIDGLLHSPPHRANILNTAFKHVGIGETCGVVVQLFGD